MPASAPYERLAQTGRPGLGISAGLSHHAELLLDQQIWCFGRDIRHDGGNALLERGFQVERPPVGAVGGSAYTLTMPSGDRLILWGFGLCFGGGDPALGLIHLRRFQFHPTWRAEATLPGPAWDTTTRFPRFARPRGEPEWERVRRLTAQALLALADHEDWVHAHLGPNHRRACVATWTKARFAPGRVAPSWRALARRIAPGPRAA